MTRENLEKNEKLFVSDYDNMILYAESFEVGAKAWVVNKDYIEDEVPEVEEMKVAFALHRRDSERKYDKLASKDNLMSAYRGDFCCSGEFVTNDDIIYVFFDTAPQVYAVTTLSQDDYDFSVTMLKHGAFEKRENALARLKEVVAKFKENYQNEFEKYSNEDDYPNEESGALVIEDDIEQLGYWRCSFGFEEHHQTHQITIEEWEMEG